VSNIVHLNAPRPPQPPPVPRRRADDDTAARAVRIALIVAWSVTVAAFGYMIGAASSWP
jgi:hypothetical protein